MLESTFRDPAGQLRLTENCALRRIHPGAEEATRDFLTSPLRATLEGSGDLIASRIADPCQYSCVRPSELWLEHPRIDPLSSPWEWSAGQWQAAAELTLRIEVQAVEAGWTLKDATPLNILFLGARPILVDVLSLERRDPRSSVWLAYAQFVRTFLLPLVAAKSLGWPLQNTLFERDGYEPRAIYRALNPWRRFHPDLFDVVTLAAWFENARKETKRTRADPAPRDLELVTHILRCRIARLLKQTRRATPGGNRSRWSDYTQWAGHYSAADLGAKQQFMRFVLERWRPARVLDIGANAGVYSLLAAEAGAQVAALDNDAGAIEQLWRTAARQSKPITALAANIARPTPAAGWRNREHLSLLDQLSGIFDLVLMLAVLHHLILREQLPLGHVAELCAWLTRRWLVLEWVPPSDPMYQEWLRGRDHLYGQLSESDRMEAFSSYFQIARRIPLADHRVLLLFERRAGDTGLEQPGPGAGRA